MHFSNYFPIYRTFHPCKYCRQHSCVYIQKTQSFTRHRYLKCLILLILIFSNSFWHCKQKYIKFFVMLNQLRVVKETSITLSCITPSGNLIQKIMLRIYHICGNDQEGCHILFFFTRRYKWNTSTIKRLLGILFEIQ